MKQIEQSYRTGELSVSEVPAPQMSAGSVLVATRTSLISSGTEKQLMDLAKASLAGKAMARPDLVRQTLRKVQNEGLKPTIEKVFAKLDTPIPLGYSLAGQVVDVGRRVPGYAVGDRVACAGAGLANHAEFNAVPKNLTVRIPDAVSDEDASFVTLGAIALQGVRQAGPTLGERVVVMGLGLIGLLTVQLLKANGCQVLGFDPNAERAKLAMDLGADLAVSSGLFDAVDGFTEGYGADAVILAASTKSSEPVNQAAEISRMRGRIVVVGLVGMELDREPFYKRELELKLSLSYGPGRHDPNYEISGNDYPLPFVRWTEQRNMSSFLQLIAEGRVTPQALITHRFAIDAAEEAYELMERGDPHLAMLLTYPDYSGGGIERSLSRPATAPKSGTIGVGFLGLGNYAKGVLLPVVKGEEGISLTSVATSTGISASNAGKKYGFATVATDPEAVISDPDTDAVFVVTRHDSHADLATAALRAGKHVFCEKPLAMDLEQLDAVLAAAQGSTGMLTVGFNRRFAPLLIDARKALEPRSGPLMMTYRVNAGAIPSDSWVQRDEGGGRIIGEVCHFIDAMVALSGSLPMEIQAAKARGHDDAASILIRFQDGSIGTVVYSSLGDPSVPKEYIEVFAKGTVIQLSDFTRLDIARNGKTSSTKSGQNKGQAAMIAAFLETIRQGQGPLIPYAELEAVTEATFAIEEAVRSGQTVAL